jgi:hypothetical protein
MHKILPIIIEVLVLDLSEQESINYLRDRGFKISVRYLYILKKKVKENRFSRLALIAKEQFQDQHIQRLENLEVIQKEYWKLYRLEKKIFNKALILQKIAELQTYISSYYQASRMVLEKSVEEKKKRKKVEEQIEQ